uniref:Putative bilaris n=1 Tax=Rhipicephalus pulchellus TaxID=72859 RepID=L7M9P3_RHIPC
MIRLLVLPFLFSTVSGFCNDPFTGKLYNTRCTRLEWEKRYKADPNNNKCVEIEWNPCKESINVDLVLEDCLRKCASNSTCIKDPAEVAIPENSHKYHYYFDKNEGTCYSKKGPYEPSKKGQNHFEKKDECEKTCSPRTT